jgi:hypothetical protein
MRRSFRLSRLGCLLVLLLIIVPLVGQRASLPHTHSGPTPGFFNEEHDLTLLATSGAAALPDVLPLVFAFTVVALVAVQVPRRPMPVAFDSADSRAPPLA